MDATGKDQARALGALFGPVPLTTVITSPLQRARDTGVPIAVSTGASQFVDPRLIDRDYGVWAGHSPAEIEARFGRVDAAPGVEERAAVMARALSPITDWAAELAPGPFAVVAHDFINTLLLADCRPIRS